MKKNKDTLPGLEDAPKGKSEKPTAPVADIAAARKKKEQMEMAPLEAYAPQAIKLQDDDWQISGCDGEQTYLWLAFKKSKRSKTLTVTEVYPGLRKKRTALRDADEPIDLELEGRFKDMGEVLEELEDIIFGDFIEDDEEVSN